MGSIPGAYPGTILVKGYVSHPMQLVFNRPMTSIVAKKIGGRGSGWCKARQSIGDFFPWILALQIGCLALDSKHLTDMGEVEIVVQCARGLDTSCFNPSMAFCCLAISWKKNRLRQSRRCRFSDFVDCLWR